MHNMGELSSYQVLHPLAAREDSQAMVLVLLTVKIRAFKNGVDWIFPRTNFNNGTIFPAARRIHGGRKQNATAQDDVNYCGKYVIALVAASS